MTWSDRSRAFGTDSTLVDTDGSGIADPVLAVTRHDSFSGAARELGVSGSAASQTARHLEEQLRVVLLARTTRIVWLTDAGRRLVDGAAVFVNVNEPSSRRRACFGHHSLHRARYRGSNRECC